jgi:hypothetical protein
MIKESYVAKLNTLPVESITVDIGYPTMFAPPEQLLVEFNHLIADLIEKGYSNKEARKIAWKQTDFEKRYRKKITSTPQLIHSLKIIKHLAEKKDVYLYCYCGHSLCPRFILMDMIKEL